MRTTEGLRFEAKSYGAVSQVRQRFLLWENNERKGRQEQRGGGDPGGANLEARGGRWISFHLRSGGKHGSGGTHTLPLPSSVSLKFVQTSLQDLVWREPLRLSVDLVERLKTDAWTPRQPQRQTIPGGALSLTRPQTRHMVWMWRPSPYHQQSQQCHHHPQHDVQVVREPSGPQGAQDGRQTSD